VIKSPIPICEEVGEGGDRISVFSSCSGWFYFKNIKDVRKLLYACCEGDFLELQNWSFGVISGLQQNKSVSCLYIGKLMV